MKHLALFFFCLCVPFLCSAQDENKRVQITANQDPTEVETNSCILYISAIQSSDSENVDISVEIENRDNYYIYLFGHAYDEKNLKKQKPSIRFDKRYTSNREIKVCTGLDGDNIMQIEFNDRRLLHYFGKINNDITCVLPLYLVTKRPKKFLRPERYLITRRILINLHINVKSQIPEPDPFDELKQKYDDLVEELSNKTFCPNSKHEISLAVQKQPYQTRIEEIKEEINRIKSANNWTDRSPEYRKYKELLNKLDEIVFQEKDCGKHVHVPIPHRCKYDNWTPKQALDELNNLYTKVATRKVDKSTAVTKASEIRRKYTGGCPVLTSKMNNESSVKTHAEKYYNDIVNY